MHTLFRDRHEPADGSTNDWAAASAAGDGNAAAQQQHPPNAFAAYAMGDDSNAQAAGDAPPGTRRRRRRTSAPIDKVQRWLLPQDCLHPLVSRPETGCSTLLSLGRAAML
jgi:hypothetical protein